MKKLHTRIILKTLVGSNSKRNNQYNLNNQMMLLLSTRICLLSNQQWRKSHFLSHIPRCLTSKWRNIISINEQIVIHCSLNNHMSWIQRENLRVLQKQKFNCFKNSLWEIKKLSHIQNQYMKVWEVIIMIALDQVVFSKEVGEVFLDSL